MAKRLAELGALQDAVSNDEAAPKRLGLAGYIRGLFLDWSANPYNPLTRLSARGRLLGYFWDSGAIGLSMNFADQNYLVKDGTVKSKSFSDIVNFTRTTNATVTNSAGLITYAPHNLLTHSEQFDNAAWIKDNILAFGSGSVANSTIAPNGSQTADLITPNTSNTFHRVYTFSSGTATSMAFSAYVKSNGYSKVGLRESLSTGAGATFDLATNTVIGAYNVGGSTVSNMAIVDAGNGWYRISCAISFASATSMSFGISILSPSYVAGTDLQTAWTPNGTSGLYIWGADLEIGSTATTYNSTTVKNLLGFSELFDNAAWSKSNSFVQTNLVTYSEDYSATDWTKTQSSIVSNTVIAPNGYQTADKLVENTVTSVHTIERVPLTIGATQTISIYAKSAGQSRYLQYIGAGLSGAGEVPTFNLDNGTVDLGTTTTILKSASITPVGDGWYRCVATIVPAATSFSFALSNSATLNTATTYLGDGVSGLFIWGAQIVNGSVAGDYRRTDAASLPVYYPNHNGVVVAEKLVENTATSTHVLSLNTASLTTNTLYTASIYAKAAERRYLTICENVASASRVCFDLQTGTIVASAGGGTSSIISIGNGWYRLSLTRALVSGTSFGCLFGLSDTPTTAVPAVSYAGDGTSGVYIFGAQLSDSASLDPYVLNAAAAPTAAAYYGARFDYDPVTLAPKGLLIEEQRSNLLLNSAIAGTNLATQNVTVTAVAHTLSFYGTGNIVLSGTASATLTGTGAYPTRSTLTFTPTAGTLTLTVTGTVQFAQLEIGSFATSFIPTGASQVTRAADVATIQGSNFYSWYNQNEGTLVGVGSSIPTNSVTTGTIDATIACVNDTSISNSMAIMRGDSGNALSRFNGIFATANQFNIRQAVWSANSLGKISGAYKINDFAMAFNGGNATTDSLGTAPIVSQLNIGGFTSTAGNWDGTIKSISYYPQRLSNEVIKGLTA